MTEVEWRDIPGFEGMYQASSQGFIRSVKSPEQRSKRWARVLSATPDSNGYLKVQLVRDGVKRSLRVHRLVALAFHGEPQPGQRVVRHLGDNHLNNRPENLRWGTHAENNLDAVANGLNRNAAKTKCKRGHSLGPDGDVRVTKTGARICNACRRERYRASLNANNRAADRFHAQTGV